jgi:hypothetical protein
MLCTEMLLAEQTDQFILIDKNPVVQVSGVIFHRTPMEIAPDYVSISIAQVSATLRKMIKLPCV